MPNTFWGLAVEHVVFGLNRHKRVGSSTRTPFFSRFAREYTGVPLFPFGCQATCRIMAHDKKLDHKFSPTGTEVVMVGYSREGKGYRVIPMEQLLKGTHKLFVYDVEVPTSSIRFHNFPVRKLSLPQHAEFDVENHHRGTCATCTLWQTVEPLTCPPCRAKFLGRKVPHRPHTSDWRCANHRCTCVDWTLKCQSGADGFIPLDEVLDDTALLDVLDDLQPDGLAPSGGVSSPVGPGHAPGPPAFTPPPIALDFMMSPDDGFTPLDYQYDDLAWDTIGPPDAFVLPDGDIPPVYDVPHDDADADEYIGDDQFNFADILKGMQENALEFGLPTTTPHREWAGGAGAVTRLGSSGHRIDTDYVWLPSHPRTPGYEFVYDPIPGVDIVPLDYEECSGLAPEFSHVAGSGLAPAPCGDSGLAPESSSGDRAVDAYDLWGGPVCVAKPFQLKKAIELDAAGVQAAIHKEQTKLLDTKSVYSEEEIVEKDVLRRRCIDAQSRGKSHLPKQMRFSKILLKVFKKGWELEEKLQKWSARACVDGSWVTDAATGKQASDQLPAEQLESTPISLENLRMFIFQSCALGHTLFAGDVTGAYLETELGAGSPEIWVEVPEALRKDKPRWANKVCPMVRLLKALYGLPRAGHDWDRYMRLHLHALGWTPLQDCNSIYAKTIRGKICLLGVYVDDMVVSCPDELVDVVRGELSKAFPIEWNEFTPAHVSKGAVVQELDLRFLGVRVTISRSRTTYHVTFSQVEYARSIVAVYEEKCKRKCRVAWTPAIKLEDKLTESETPGAYAGFCREILGKLLFLERCSRIDIIQAVTTLCGRVSRWMIADDKALDRLMDYVAHTSGMELEWTIDSMDCESITASLLTDSDWATCKDTSKSVSSYNLTLVGARTKATVIWGTRKQTFIARSTAEAESGAHVDGLVRALLPALLFIDSLSHFAKTNSLLVNLRWVPTARCDNNAACTSFNSILAGRLSLLAKSSRMNLHWARAQLRRCGILVTRIATELNCADLGSKALPQQVHWRLAYTLMTAAKQIHDSVSWSQGESTSGWAPSSKVLGEVW